MPDLERWPWTYGPATYGPAGDWVVSNHNWPIYTATTSTAANNIVGEWVTWASTTTNTPYRWGGNIISASVMDGWTPDCAPYNNVETIADPTRIQELERRQRAADAQMEVRRAARAVADSRAQKLLLSMLPDAQKQTYLLDAHFEVIGSHGTLYRIKVGVSGNVEWIRPDGTVGGKLCAHPSMRDGRLPTPDVMLAQFLALVTDERQFLAKANLHAGERPVLALVA